MGLRPHSSSSSSDPSPSPVDLALQVPGSALSIFTLYLHPPETALRFSCSPGRRGPHFRPHICALAPPDTAIFLKAGLTESLQPHSSLLHTLSGVFPALSARPSLVLEPQDLICGLILHVMVPLTCFQGSPPSESFQHLLLPLTSCSSPSPGQLLLTLQPSAPRGGRF